MRLKRTNKETTTSETTGETYRNPLERKDPKKTISDKSDNKRYWRKKGDSKGSRIWSSHTNKTRPSKIMKENSTNSLVETTKKNQSQEAKETKQF